MVGNTHGVNSNLVYFLGTGTLFNVSNIPGYKKFSVDNFLPVITGASAISTDLIFFSKGGNWSGASVSGFTVSKAYDPATGQLTISATQQIEATCNNTDQVKHSSQNMNISVYLIKGKIKTI